MNTLTILATISLGAAAMPLVLGLRNLQLFRRAPAARRGERESVSVCVPARNEEHNLDACVRSILAACAPGDEVLVYDDQSTDGTAAALDRLVRADARVRAVVSRPLPGGWNGKQHACWRMSREARGAWLLFTDADVRFEPGAIDRALAAAAAYDVRVVSAFPRQIVGTAFEAMVVPLIYFVLLGYLPFDMMRRGMRPSASAACGQFILARRDAYEAVGGHEAVRDSMHEGVKLPRVFRRAGIRTDVVDGMDLARVRMYRGMSETWRGFTKNAYEGLGSVVLLVFITVLHLVGHVAPWILLGAQVASPADQRLITPPAVGLLGAAILAGLAFRVLLAARFTPNAWGLIAVVSHPPAMLVLAAIQWWSLILDRRGRRSWKGRISGAPSAEVEVPQAPATRMEPQSSAEKA